MSESSFLGRVVWREAMTRDVAKAKRFYGELFGWSFQDMNMGPGGTYPTIQCGGKGIGGLMAMPAEMKMPCYWGSYVSVPDVDRACEAAKAAGGAVPWGPVDIPNVGRMATILDADQACISVIKTTPPDPHAPGRPGVGEFCWETLSTSDVERAKAFYTKVMPWKAAKGAGMDTFSVGEGMENQVADIQKAQGPVPPNWLTFVVVAKLEPSAARAEQLGGRVLMPPMAIPTIGRIAVVADDQGAAIGLFEPGGI